MVFKEKQMKKCFKVGIFATLGLMLCSLGLASKGGVVETDATGLATYASFSRASSVDTVTGGTFSHTTGMREFTDSYGEYGAGTKGDGSIVYMQILSSTAYLSDAPASGDLVITSKLSSDGSAGISGNVYGVLLKESGEELGDPVVMTNYIPSDGNAKEYSIRINVEECFSQVYGVKVYKIRTATSGVDALYYSMNLSAGGAKVKLDTKDFKMPIGGFTKTIKATPVLMVEPYTYTWEIKAGETVSIISGADTN